jgi:PP-loop superfamily ATP-utilizing enzyme
MPDPKLHPTTSFEAHPDHVHRVLLLYSGGLDTSVLLKWIQDEYDAEVVALTVSSSVSMYSRRSRQTRSTDPAIRCSPR